MRQSLLSEDIPLRIIHSLPLSKTSTRCPFPSSSEPRPGSAVSCLPLRPLTDKAPDLGWACSELNVTLCLRGPGLAVTAGKPEQQWWIRVFIFEVFSKLPLHQLLNSSIQAATDTSRSFLARRSQRGKLCFPGFVTRSLKERNKTKKRRVAYMFNLIFKNQFIFKSPGRTNNGGFLFLRVLTFSKTVLCFSLFFNWNHLRLQTLHLLRASEGAVESRTSTLTPWLWVLRVPDGHGMVSDVKISRASCPFFRVKV